MKFTSMALAAALLTSVTAVGAMAQTDNSSSTATPPAATTPKTGMHTGMHKGAMSKTRVEAIQTALKNNGEDVTSDGVWGPKTVAAVRDFQTKNGLKATGHVDRATAQKLNLQKTST